MAGVEGAWAREGVVCEIMWGLGATLSPGFYCK